MTAKELLQELSDRILDVDDVVGMPGTPCPAQSQDTIHAARRLLMAHAGEVGIVVPKDTKSEAPAKEGEPGQCPPDAAQGEYALPSIGPAPYEACLVFAFDGAPVCVMPEDFDQEPQAVEALLVEAERRGLPVDYGCIRHWITGNLEHIVDFGSHGVYGRVTSKPNEERHDRIRADL